MGVEAKEMEAENYETWYMKRVKELASLLMKALKVACTISEHDEIWGPIKEKVQSFGLEEDCRRCGIKVPFWDWAMYDGYCYGCLTEIIREYEEEQMLEGEP